MTLSFEEIYRQQADSLVRETREGWLQALAKWHEALQENPQSEEAYLHLAQCHIRLRQHRDAISVLRQGFARCGPSVSLYLAYIPLLEECNRTKEAIAAAQEAKLAFPDDVWLKLKEALLLPIVYASAAEIRRYRLRFTQGLRKICNEIDVDSPDVRLRAQAAVARHVNLRLGYQGENERSLQSSYGDLVHKIMAASYPHWAARRPMPPISADGKLRIGYISSRFRDLSASKYFLGWLREHTGKIVVYAYHVGRKTDSITKEVGDVSHSFRHIPLSLEDTCEAIVADRLHVLVYLDIGIDPIMTQLAALRLAPVQCMAWDQPITSGLPSVDYFLSGNLTEPEDAQDHYSEQLVRLPGVGVNYRKPVIPAVLLKKTRQDFLLREDAVVYLCSQYAYKYLPDQDHLFAKIAAQVPHAQFVFLTENDFIAADLTKRLDRAFWGAGLRASDYCVLLPAIERFTYWNLNLVGDVFLDAMGWSGGVSTFEAIACRLPIVTMPGKFMRGRQSHAILTQLGVTDTIARDTAEYVDIAVRLGLDRAWREDVIREMMRGFSALYSDTRCVAALEDFYWRVVREGLQTQ